MELIKNLPILDEHCFTTENNLNDLIKNNEYIVVKICYFNSEKRCFLCSLDKSDKYGWGYIPIEDYSIYTIKNPFDEIEKVVYVYVKEWNENYRMWHLTRKDLLVEQIKLANCEETVIAKVTSFYNEKLAFCEFGVGIYGNISLAKYIYIPQALYSLADLLQIGSTFKAVIEKEYKENHFALTSFRIEDFSTTLKINTIVKGKVLARLENDEDFRYSYWFMIEMDPGKIGIIKSDRPLGYGQLIYAKLHSKNNNFIKFHFVSYVN